MPETKYNFSFTGSIDTFIVPESGVYKISAWGASGGGVNKPKGAFSQSFVFLMKEQIIFFLIGESGDSGDPNSPSNKRCGGGGGGTFVATGNSISTSNPLCVAGGGGSQNHLDIVYSYAHGQPTRTGGDSGNRQQVEGEGGLSYFGSGGGGFYSNGQTGSVAVNDVRGSPGIGFVNGGNRVSGTHYSNAHGGFGGGAANHGGCGHNQGGGGYTGGSSYGAYDTNNGGGGGSFYLNHTIFFGCSIGGFDYMPDPKGTGYISGNLDNGFAQIALVSNHIYKSTSCQLRPGIYIEYRQISPLIFSLFVFQRPYHHQ